MAHKLLKMKFYTTKSLSKYEHEAKKGYWSKYNFKLRDQRTLSFSVDDTFNIKTPIMRKPGQKKLTSLILF